MNELSNEPRDFLSKCLIILGWLLMLIFAFHSCTHMVGAGDTWVAMACGRHFTNQGVDTVEPFSANSHKAGPTEEDVANWPGPARWIAEKVGMKTVKYWHPTGWINQNWLTHVIFYKLTPPSSYEDGLSFTSNALVYWKFVTYLITVICVYYTARLLGAHYTLAAILACFAVFAGRSFYDVRPAGFSNMLVAVYLLTLALVTYRNYLYIWLLVPIGIFWCNLHGGYIYIFIMLVPFFLFNLPGLFFKKFKTIGIKGLYHSVAAGIATFIATIVFNPFHLTNLTHTFVISLSKSAEKWRSVNEWHPAFEWKNPVGTSFPFLVLYIICLALPILWLTSSLLKPRQIKAPKNEMDNQQKFFDITQKIFICMAVVFIAWVACIGFSFLSLDFVSFMVCALFVLIIVASVYKNVHFIYAAAALALTAVMLSDKDDGYTGRYIYSFLILPGYVLIAIVLSSLSKKINIKKFNIIFVVGASVIVMAITLGILSDKFTAKTFAGKINELWTIQRPWRPVYEGKQALNRNQLFPALYLLNFISIIVWIAFVDIKRLFTRLQPVESVESQKADVKQASYVSRPVDLAMIVIAGFTIYMAIRSRRFITIAAIAACPVIAMIVTDMIRSIASSNNFFRNKNFTLPRITNSVKAFLVFLAAAAVLGFGSWWSLKYKYVYLDASPTDTKYNSVFIRMTASDAKPFYACKFIKDNHLDGKMFNYWTEGGFIAWGQKPDEKTGKTPLQLFMDGRAQAAYDRKAFETWTQIMSGGPEVRNVMIRKKKFNNADYVKVGNWVDKQLKKRDVWLVMMPATQFKAPMFKGLEQNQDWRLVFLNNKQKIIVDITTERGRKLFDGIIDNTTAYPTEFTKNIILARNLMNYEQGNDMKMKAFDFAKKAFKLHPSQVSTMELIMAESRLPKLKDEVGTILKNYIDDFIANHSDYVNQDGYHHKAVASMLVCDYLRNIGIRQQNKDQVDFYANKKKELVSELRMLRDRKRW